MAVPDPRKDGSTATTTGSNVAGTQPVRGKLPKALQDIVDNDTKDDTLYEEIWDGTYGIS